MRSLVNIIRQDKADPLETALEVTRAVTQSAVAEAILRHGPQYAQFCRDIEAQLSRLGDKPTVGDLCAAGSEIADCLRSYREVVETCLNQRHRKIQSMLRMLMDAVSDLAGPDGDAARQLEILVRDIEAGSWSSDPSLVAARLAECLSKLRCAATRQRMTIAEAANLMEREIQTLRARLAELEQPATGNGAGGKDDNFLAAVQVRYGDRIESKFGIHALRQMVAMVRNELKQVLAPCDRMISPSRTSFLLMIRSAQTATEVRNRVGAAVGRLRQQRVELGERAALLAVVVDWELFRVADYQSPEQAIAAADAFFARDQAPRQLRPLQILPPSSHGRISGGLQA